MKQVRRHTGRVLLGAFRGCTSYTLPYWKDEMSRHRYSGSHVLIYPGLLLQLLKLHRCECCASTTRDRCHKRLHFLLKCCCCCSCNRIKKNLRGAQARILRANRYKYSICRYMLEYLVGTVSTKADLIGWTTLISFKFMFIHVHGISENQHNSKGSESKVFSFLAWLQVKRT